MNNSKDFLRQMSKIMTNPEYEWVMLDDSNDNENIRLLFEGPKNSVYENGLYRVTLDFYDKFPNKPPKVLFKTKIWHPLIEFSSGKMCHDYFTENWDEKTSDVKTFLNLLNALLSNYKMTTGSAVNHDALAQINNNTFDEVAKNINEKYAIQ